MMICENFRLSDEQVQQFERRGFIKLAGFLSGDALELLDRILEHELRPTPSTLSEFSRFRYDMESDADLEVVSHPDFGRALTRLCQRPMLYTQHLGFEIQQNESTGLPWHVGTLSFAYHQLEDFGCTLWIPLAKIDTGRQGGGMKYVSRERLSGRFLFQYSTTLSAYADERERSGQPVTPQEMHHLDFFIPNSPEVAPMLEQIADCDDFEPGDALLFCKDVIHRSCPLREGPLTARKAFVMRFVDADSTYDRWRVDKLDPFKRLMGYGEASSFPDRVGRVQGERIADSPLFTDTLERRLLLAE